MYFSLPFNSLEFAERLKLAEETNKIFDANAVANALPARKWLPWNYVIPSMRHISHVYKTFREQNRNFFNEHMQSLDPDHIRDILDAMVVQRNAMQVEGETINFTDRHAAAVMMDIVLGKLKRFIQKGEY